MLHYSSGPLHEQPAQVLVSALGNFPQCLLTSGRVFLRNHAQDRAAKSRPLRNAVPLPIVAMIAVAITRPTPGIFTSLRQASFSRAIFSTDLSARSIFSASCSSSCFSSASNANIAPDRLC